MIWNLLIEFIRWWKITMIKNVIHVNELEVEVVRKNIKNIHLAVYPPDAKVTIAAPDKYSLEDLKFFALSKLNWITKNRKIIQNQNRIPPKEFVTGESHYLFGKRYRLFVEEADKAGVDCNGINKIFLFVPHGADLEVRKKILENWYRKQLRDKLDTLFPLWEKRTGLYASSWQIRKMKTKWGSCKVERKAVYLNLELAKTPVKNIEYIILHELLHLHERTHNQNFTSLLDKFMPNWKLYKEDLNSITFEG